MVFSGVRSSVIVILYKGVGKNKKGDASHIAVATRTPLIGPNLRSTSKRVTFAPFTIVMPRKPGSGQNQQGKSRGPYQKCLDKYYLFDLEIQILSIICIS